MKYLYFLFTLVFIFSCNEDTTNNNTNGKSQPRQLTVGNGYISSQYYDDILLSQSIDTVINIGTTIEPIPILVNKSFKVYSDEIEEIEYAKENDVRSFLQETWDSYIDGVEEEGVNGKEYIYILDKYGINAHIFLQLFQQSNMTISEFMEFIELIRVSVDNVIEDNQEVYEFYHFLEKIEMNFDEFLIALDNSGITRYTYFTNIGKNNISFKDLYELYYQIVEMDGLTINDFFIQTGGVINKKNNEKIQANPLLYLTRAVWAILSFNKPETKTKNTSTSVLLKTDKDWANYYSCKSFSTKKYRWLLTDIYTIHLVDISFKIEGHHNCKHDDPKGDFISEAGVTFLNVYTLWPWSANGHVDISKVSNIGTLDDINPSIRFSVTLDASCLQAVSKTWNKTITGR
ncbi:MAG: hypothetical protein V1779_17330 [bacterium]